ncbi:MAG: hypothetical protein QM572_04465 [Nocardioides sp.]|uniref:hypothetical protein n=1 Tax=Nocardioides sp. TaxID=35761 RepID=UPI0039E65EB3
MGFVLIAGTLVAGPVVSPGSTTYAEAAVIPETGAYVDPIDPAEPFITSDGASAASSPIFQVEATGSLPSVTVTVTRADGSTALSVQDRYTNWGFSPDQATFVAWYVDGSQTIVRSWRLGAGSAVAGLNDSFTGDLTMGFSKGGRYLAAAGATNGQFTLRIYDTTSYAVAYSTTAQTYGVADDGGWLGFGFSPDDGGFVLAYREDSQTVSHTLIDLDQHKATTSWTETGVGFWQFSPCGNYLADVEQHGAGTVDTTVYRVDQGTPAYATSSGVVDISFRATTDSHIATIDGVDQTMFANTLGCGTPDGGTVTGTFFEDWDRDGVRDADEPPANMQLTVGGVTAQIGSDGAFTASEVPLGTQPIAVGQSDWDLTGATQVTVTSAGQTVTNVVVGVARPDDGHSLLLHGKVYVDTDADGVRDPGEPTVSGISLQLLHQYDAIERRWTTDARTPGLTADDGTWSIWFYDPSVTDFDDYVVYPTSGTTSTPVLSSGLPPWARFVGGLGGRPDPFDLAYPGGGTPPYPVTSITATPGGHSATLSWIERTDFNQSNGITGYVVQRLDGHAWADLAVLTPEDTTTSEPLERNTDLWERSILLLGLTPGETYTLRVVYLTAAGRGFGSWIGEQRDGYGLLVSSGYVFPVVPTSDPEPTPSPTPTPTATPTPTPTPDPTDTSSPTPDLTSSSAPTTTAPTVTAAPVPLPGAPRSWVRAWPRRSGTARVRHTVTVSRPVLSAAGKRAHAVVTYQWLLDGRPITSATRPRLRIPVSAKGRRLSIRVSVVASGYRPLAKTISFGRVR